jgi:hypothetical protein
MCCPAAMSHHPLPQDVFNLLPNLDVDAIVKAFTLQVSCIALSV